VKTNGATRIRHATTTMFVTAVDATLLDIPAKRFFPDSRARCARRYYGLRRVSRWSERAAGGLFS
jgi:hypothetical protein